MATHGSGEGRIRVRAVQPMGRSCGGCTACCTSLAVEELGKPAWTRCRFARSGRGCSAYKDRPQSCSDFSCLWLDGLVLTDQRDRPDRCGLVLAATDRPRTVQARELWPNAASTGRGAELVRVLRRAQLTVVVTSPNGGEMLRPITVEGRPTVSATTLSLRGV